MHSNLGWFTMNIFNYNLSAHPPPIFAFVRRQFITKETLCSPIENISLTAAVPTHMSTGNRKTQDNNAFTILIYTMRRATQWSNLTWTYGQQGPPYHVHQSSPGDRSSPTLVMLYWSFPNPSPPSLCADLHGTPAGQMWLWQRLIQPVTTPHIERDAGRGTVGPVSST